MNVLLNSLKPGENVSKFASRVAAVLLIGLVLAFASDVFLTQSNLLNVFRQASLLFLMASTFRSALTLPCLHALRGR
jgi:ribose transport system permease protein